MDFKQLAITATLGGSILLTGVVFTGSVNLADIKNYGFGWADRLNTSVNETKDMLQKFNLFKGDVKEQLNEKIAKINDLNAKIADLVSKVGAGEVNLEGANNEIARLNEELDKANQEVQALKDEYQLKDSEVQAVFSEMATAESMDTSLVLDEQQADTVIPEDTEAPEAPPEEPEAPEAPEDYATEETAIYNMIMTNHPSVTGLTVTMTDSTIVLNGTGLSTIYNNSTFKANLGSSAGVTITAVNQDSTNKYTYYY